MELDGTDIEILRHLQDNARLSFRELAKKVGVSVPTISAHVNTMEELGVIRGYRADIDPERIREYSVLLSVKCSPSRIADVAGALAEIEAVRWVMTARDPRVFAMATVAREDDINALLDAAAQTPDVLDYEHFVISSAVKDEPRAMIADGLSTSLICFECKGPIHGDPVKVKMDGRDHYLCCHTCEKLYVDRYQRMKAKA